MSSGNGVTGGIRRLGLGSWMSTLAVVLAAGTVAATAFHSGPDVTIDTSRVKFEIVRAQFVSEYEGASYRFKESEPDKYRGLVLTVRITKPAGMELAMAVPDLPLHYYYGSSGESDVAPCNGVSSFSTTLDTDRTMKLSNGWARTTTQTATQEASTIYVDLFYQNMEPTTSDLYLLVAHDVGTHFVSRGWSH